MNRLKTVLLLAFLGLITACSYNELPEDLTPRPFQDVRLVQDVETRAETYKGQPLDQDYFVTAEDLNNYAKYRRSTSKRSDFSVKEVKSYGFDSAQTLFYILNYDQGWEVVAADKRVQPSLAHGDSGEFTMDCDNEPMKFWMNMLADGVLQTRLGNFDKDDEVATASTASTDSERSGETSQGDYVDFWNTISPQADATRGDILIPTPGPLEPLDPIYTYVVDEEIETNTYIIDPLLVTQWDQDFPWNGYCPPISSGSSVRAPAGCVAIAGAQALYYYHHYFDMNNTAPSSATTSGYLNNHWQITFGNESTIVWDNMAITSSESTYRKQLSGILIAHVGKLIEMHYDANSSSAYTVELPEKVFAPYGLSCELDDYDSSIIVQNIKNNLPVVIRGQAAEVSGEGHAWVIDGYENINNIVTRYYVSYTTPQTEPFIDSLDKEDAHYSRTTTEHVSSKVNMNWGWNNSDDGYFSLIPEEWILYNGGVPYAYQYHIKIIHDFAEN